MRFLRLVLGLSTLLVAAALLGCSAPEAPVGPREKTDGESVAVEVNALAPAFAGKTLGGGEVRLADYVGSHVVLLEFWSVFCKSCLEEMPHIEELQRRYGADGLQVISVNTDVFSASRIQKTLDRAGLHPPYPVVLDVRQEVVKAYNVEVLPVTVVVDRSGWIRLYQEGYRPGDESRFERVVRRYLGKEGAGDVTLASRGGVTAFAPAGGELVAVGSRVPELRSNALGGQEVRVGRGSPQLLFFWSLYCRPCRAEFGPATKLAERFQGQGLRVWAVNVDNPALEPRIRRFLAGRRSPPCVVDWGGRGIARALGVRATPSVVLLDAEGRVVHAAEGRVEWEQLEGAVEGMLAARGR
ncbi:MAG: TlpA family protein disulfide reductase [Candidatus Dadabacteria bacterium]|nr:MAG: TlpA family protein disulfide reductase [Candidatus Dadabacteria bacterium]